ncbi:MAG: photosynthetic complex assembly protein PuhC [Pseudomonadota bacterium]
MTTEQEKLLKRDKEMIPLVLIRAMFFLALLSVALVAYARLTDRPLVGVASTPDIAAETKVLLVPNPEQRGGFFITDLTGDVLVTSSDHKAGFVGVIGQALTRKRMMTDTDQTAPLRIVQRVDGRIDIIDTGSGFSVELMSYGADNIAVFANLIKGVE